MKRLLTALALLAVLPFLIAATNVKRADRIETSRGYSWRICNAESTTGVCDNADGTDQYVIVDDYEEITFYFSQSNAVGTTTCNVKTASQFVDVPGTADLSAITTVAILSTDMSVTAPTISVKGTFYYMWAECTIVGGSTATVVIQGATGTSGFF